MSKPPANASPVLDDTVWSRLAARYGSLLRGPASASDLASAASALGRALPPVLAQAYAHHDGDVDLAASGILDSLVAGARWLPLRESLERRATLRYGYESEHYADWFLLGASETKLVWVFPDDERLFWSSRRRLEPLRTTTWQWLRALGARPQPAESQPARAPDVPKDRAARVLLATLLERGHIALDAPSPEPLIASLASALRARKHGPVAAVLSALEGDDAVEIFADDDIIASVVAQL